MKFVDELPSRQPTVSQFRDWITADNLARLKRNPGKWALLREDVPETEATSAGNYLRKQYRVDVALCRTVPNGTERDLYVGWQCREVQR